MAACVCVLAGSLAHGQGTEETAERARIASQRAAVELGYTQRVRECETQFVVTACVDAAKADRRKANERLDREQAVLDDAQRRRRAEAQLERIARKQRAMAERAASAPQPRVVRREPPPAAASREPLLPRGALPSGQSISPAEQAANRLKFEQRQQEAAAHRAKVERRNAVDGRGEPAALPVPAASAAASAASAP